MGRQCVRDGDREWRRATGARRQKLTGTVIGQGEVVELWSVHRFPVTRQNTPLFTIGEAYRNESPGIASTLVIFGACAHSWLLPRPDIHRACS